MNCYICKNWDEENECCSLPIVVSSFDINAECEEFEETFEHHWEMMDDIEREEWCRCDDSEDTES